MVNAAVLFFVFFFQAEDGIRDLVRSRGLGDVYKRQPSSHAEGVVLPPVLGEDLGHGGEGHLGPGSGVGLSLIHI